MEDRTAIRTLHLLPELKEGGLERCVVEKVIWLQKHGIWAGVVSAGGIWADRLTKGGVEHFVLPIHRKDPVSILRCASSVRKIIREQDIHLVCAHSRAPAWAAHLATRRRGHHEPPLITEAEGYYERYWYSNVMCWGDRVIAVSGVIRDYMVESLGADRNRTVVIPKGLAPDEFPEPEPQARERLRDEWGIPDDAALVIGVGRLTHTKGWDDLIEAIAKMSPPRPYLVLVGTSHGRRRRYMSRLRDLIGANALDRQVIFAGHRDDMANVYAAADVVASPSRWPEPFGRVVIESLILGRPVVTTEGCGAAEFLGDEFRRFIVPVRNPQALADRLTETLSDQVGARAAVEVISERIRSDLTLDRQMSATLDVYRECRPDLPWPAAAS